MCKYRELLAGFFLYRHVIAQEHFRRMFRIMFRHLITVPGFSSAPKDIAAGIVVFLVALPLCLGIALASNAPLLSGLISGIIGGTLLVLFSGSELSVSGPAAGLAAVVASAIHTLGSFETFLAAVCISGLLQVGFGIVRGGIIGEFVPNSVIRGMLAAIGIIIIVKQIPHLVGWDVTSAADVEMFEMSSWNAFDRIQHLGAHIEEGALVIGLVCLLFLILWEMPFRKRISGTKLIPGPLLAVVLGTILNEVFAAVSSPLAMATGSPHMVQIPLLSEGARLLTTPNLGALLTSTQVWFTALTIAVIGSIETLLSIEASDKLDPQKRISDTNRELIAQGIANTTCGLVGGLPVTSVIVRSSTNIYAGARTRLSSLVHGILLALAVLAIPEFMNHIPITSLAAILITVGYKLTSLQIIRESWERGWDQFIPFGATIVAVVATDLLTGIVLGTIVSMYWVIRANRFSAITVHNENNLWTITFNKDASFINRSELKQALRNIPDNVSVVIDASRASVVDHDIYDTIGEFAQAATYRGITVEYNRLFGKRNNTTLRRDSGRH